MICNWIIWKINFTTKRTPNGIYIDIFSTNISKRLVWPQWWSWVDGTLQGVDSSKKISKMKMIFWFDFHRCWHGPSKIRLHFRNKSRSILKLSKNVFYKNCGPKLILFNISFIKIWTFFDVENWLWKQI